MVSLARWHVTETLDGERFRDFNFIFIQSTLRYKDSLSCYIEALMTQKVAERFFFSDGIISSHKSSRSSNYIPVRARPNKIVGPNKIV